MSVTYYTCAHVYQCSGSVESTNSAVRSKVGWTTGRLDTMTGGDTKDGNGRDEYWKVLLHFPMLESRTHPAMELIIVPLSS